MGILKNSLNAIPLSQLRPQFDMQEEPNPVAGRPPIVVTIRRRCQLVMEAMVAYYGQADQSTKISIPRDMEALPAATDAKSAIFLMSAMVHINYVLAQWKAPYSDEVLKTKLLEKLSADMFNFVSEKINSNPQYSFQEACNEVRSSCDLTTMRASQKRSAHSLYSQSESSSSASSISSAQLLAAVYPPTAIEKRIRAAEPTSTISAVDAPSNSTDNITTCWNCRNTGHRSMECPALLSQLFIFLS
jgi:hypothetical protein